MTNRTAANRYARALFDVAVKEQPGDLDLIESELAGFVSLFREHPALEKVLLNPAVPAPRKRRAVDELTKTATVAPVLTRMLGLLAERDRLVLLPEMLEAYRTRLQDHRNVVRAEVTTAAPLPPERVKAVERSLAKVTGRTVALDARVDPSIIGGVVARVGGTMYDGSITRQLEKIKAKLAEGL